MPVQGYDAGHGTCIVLPFTETVHCTRPPLMPYSEAADAGPVWFALAALPVNACGQVMFAGYEKVMVLPYSAMEHV